METRFVESFSTEFTKIYCKYIRCVIKTDVGINAQSQWLKFSFTEARLGKMRQPFLSNLLVKWQICVVEGCLIFLFAKLVTLKHKRHLDVAYVLLNDANELNVFIGMGMGICKAGKEGLAWISLHPIEQKSFEEMALREVAASKLYVFVQNNASLLRLLLSRL